MVTSFGVGGPCHATPFYARILKSFRTGVGIEASVLQALNARFFFFLFLFWLLFCSLEMRRGMQTGCLDFHKLPLLFFLDDRLSSSVSAYLIRCDRRNLSDTPRSTPKEEEEEKKKLPGDKPEDRSRALAGISI